MMKKIKNILSLLLLPFLFSCKNENAPSSEKPVSSEEIISSLNTSLNETVSSESSPSEIKGCILNTTDFPKNVAGGYPADQEIVSGDGSTFFISSCMQAGGKGDGHIQMKKGVSFFYNKTKLAGSLSFKVLRNETPSGDFTGIPTIYQGENEHPIENKVELKMAQEDKWNVYSCKIKDYFTLANESSYAIYVKDFQIDSFE